MEYFIQQLVNGVTLGSIYGLIAIGYTMVYGIIGMINFAHGDIFHGRRLYLPYSHTHGPWTDRRGVRLDTPVAVAHTIARCSAAMLI